MIQGSFFGTAAPGQRQDDTEIALAFIDEIATGLFHSGHLSQFLARNQGRDGTTEIKLATLHLYAYLSGVFGARQLAAQMMSDRYIDRLWGRGPMRFHELIAYRDRSNEALALFFTEVIVALADCGLDAILHTPLQSVAGATSATDRARAAAELAVTLLNAAKRRDDIETARYGPMADSAGIPSELHAPDERQRRVQAMLRLRAPGDGDWDQPTTLIDLGQFDALAGAPLPASFGSELESAANAAARSGLLPRLRTSDWQSAPDSAKAAPAPWTPDSGATPTSAMPALRAPSAPPRTSVASAVRVHAGPPPSTLAPLAETTVVPARASSVSQAPAVQRGDAARSSVASASAPAVPPTPRTSSGSQSHAQRVAEARPRGKTFATVAGQWLIDRWRLVIWTLLVIVASALAVTFIRF